MLAAIRASPFFTVAFAKRRGSALSDALKSHIERDILVGIYTVICVTFSVMEKRYLTNKDFLIIFR
jgi:hypothetical protein